MAESVREVVRRRAGDRCEYCRLSQSAVPFIGFHVEHIIARQHGGLSELDNLAWCCHRCNAYKGPNLSTIDATSTDVVRLFNPRLDIWADHFRRDGAEIIGLSAIGRATAQLLCFNDPYRVELREYDVES